MSVNIKLPGLSMDLVNKYLKLFLGQLVVSLLVIVIYHQCTKNQIPQLVTVDLNKLIAAQVGKVAGSKVEQQEQVQVMNKYSQVLEKVLQGYARQKNVLILTKPAVITGASDVTHLFEQKQ